MLWEDGIGISQINLGKEIFKKLLVMAEDEG
jgi:hypothetical protein